MHALINFSIEYTYSTLLHSSTSYYSYQTFINRFNFYRNHQIFLDLFFALFYFLHFHFCVCTKLFSYMTVWQTESISVQYIPKYHADLYYECFLRRNFILRQTKKFFRICYLSDFSVAILKTFTRLCLQTILQAISLWWKIVYINLIFLKYHWISLGILPFLKLYDCIDILNPNYLIPDLISVPWKFYCPVINQERTFKKMQSCEFQTWN